MKILKTVFCFLLLATALCSCALFKSVEASGVTCEKRLTPQIQAEVIDALTMPTVASLETQMGVLVGQYTLCVVGAEVDSLIAGNVGKPDATAAALFAEESPLVARARAWRAKHPA